MPCGGCSNTVPPRIASVTPELYVIAIQLIYRIYAVWQLYEPRFFPHPSADMALLQMWQTMCPACYFSFVEFIADFLCAVNNNGLVSDSRAIFARFLYGTQVIVIDYNTIRSFEKFQYHYTHNSGESRFPLHLFRDNLGRIPIML